MKKSGQYQTRASFGSWVTLPRKRRRRVVRDVQRNWLQTLSGLLWLLLVCGIYSNCQIPTLAVVGTAREPFWASRQRHDLKVSPQVEGYGRKAISFSDRSAQKITSLARPSAYHARVSQQCLLHTCAVTASRGGGGEMSKDFSSAHRVDNDDEGRVGERAGTILSKDDTRNEADIRAIVVMDGFCSYHSGYFVSQARDRGILIIPVLSDYLFEYLQFTQGKTQPEEEQASDPSLPEEAVLDGYPPRRPRTQQEWNAMLEGAVRAASLNNHVGAGDFETPTAVDVSNVHVLGVYCESDSGLQAAEELRELIGCSSRDEPVVWEARRHKSLMHKVAAQHGLRIPKQKLCHSAEEAIDFGMTVISEMMQHRGNGQLNAVVVKPYRGVGSESVFCCTSSDEIRSAFEQIVSSSVFGSAYETHDNVIVQEYLVGTEYAVDVVSGVDAADHNLVLHKIAAIWKYDKRPANGAAFCYFQTLLVDETTDRDAKVVCDFVLQTLPALGVKSGISHTEVMVVKEADGEAIRPQPILIEFNGRQHNMDFSPLTTACIGYNALDMLLDAYCKSSFAKYPDRPSLRAAGCMVHLVNYAAGTLRGLHHLQEIYDMSSVLDMEVYDRFLNIGDVIEPTIDIRSDAGWVQMINDEPDMLQQEYEQIVAWMPTIFQTELTA
jgi:ATP-grasp domain